MVLLVDIIVLVVILVLLVVFLDPGDGDLLCDWEAPEKVGAPRDEDAPREGEIAVALYEYEPGDWKEAGESEVPLGVETSGDLEESWDIEVGASGVTEASGDLEEPEDLEARIEKH